MQQVQRLIDIVARLRDPENGCPWDIEQDFKTIAPHTIEEAYEVADAIEREDFADLKSELGDLLLQVAFHSQMASEQNRFDFDDVCRTISDKLVHRHPHVFGEATANTADEVLSAWENIKADERADKSQAGLLDDVPRGFPALLRAQKLQKRAARIGLDWEAVEPVLAKLLEEIEELCDVLATESSNYERLQDELGDLLFSAVNLARHLKVDAEEALRVSNNKFEARVRRMEELARSDGQSLAQLDSERLDQLWEASKCLLAK